MTTYDELTFQQARLRALLHMIKALVSRRSAMLLPLHAVRARIQVRGQHYRGLQSIRLDHIVGSEGRADDFDRRFQPRKEYTKQRWMNILRAHHQGRALPPIDVYKLGDIYFVRDGNHRVSVARQQGQLEIEADVTELKTDARLRRELTVDDLVYLEEQSDFWEWTNLAQFRRSVTIEISELGGYLDLIGHINRHHAALRAERGAAIDRGEATAHWYDSVYVPVVTLLRDRGVLQRERGPTEADMFLAVLRHQAQLAAQGRELTLTQAAEDLNTQSRRRRLRQQVRHLQRRWAL